jgi:hypothetical protein
MTHTIAPTAHLIFKTHLDVGFTDYARNVAARYFSEFISQALTTAQTLRERGADRFIWTTGSWLIYEALERADPAGRRLIEAGIAAGDIVWHALPFTTHTELMDESLFEFGLSLSAELDRRFGHKTIAAKMTDVPGHTRGIVPLLASAGVRLLHIGVNAASRPPDVPPVFVWRAPGGAELVVIYQAGGYGDLTHIPGLDHTLAFAHTGDNLGPQTADNAIASFAQLRERMPGARVIGSTLDAFAATLPPIRAQLPVVTGEIGDTWIHGVGSDPLKVARFRELCRLRRSWLAEGRAHSADPAFHAFSRALLMIPEHTWGMDEKIYLADRTTYAAPAFQAARSTPRFQAFEASWAEQRAYLDQAIAALGDTGLAAEARAAQDALAPRAPDLGGFMQLDPASGPWQTTHFSVGFDAADGAITALGERATGRDWAGAGLAHVRYQTFSHSDYQRFRRQYNINKRSTAEWAIDDYTKPGIAEAGALSRWWEPQLAALWRREAEEAVVFLAELRMPAMASDHFGAPRRILIEAAFPSASPAVNLALQWFDKPACRLPEALWLSFAPAAPEPHGWRIDKLGQSISPLEVLRNGNRTLHAAGAGVEYRDKRGGLAIATLDAPLVAPGVPSLLHFSNRRPALQGGMHFNLYNNVWGTNFPMWFDDDMRFRFVIKSLPALDQAGGQHAAS